MNPNSLFWRACIPARLLLVYLVWKYPGRKWSGLLGIMATGITLIYVQGWRRTGWETGGQPIWWNSKRPFHAMLWGSSALLGWFPETRHLMYVPLVLDLVGGMVLQYHYRHLLEDNEPDSSD